MSPDHSKHRKYADVVLTNAGALGGVHMPPDGVTACLGDDDHEILSGFFAVEDHPRSAADGRRHRWRYIFPASSVLYFIEDLGELPLASEEP